MKKPKLLGPIIIAIVISMLLGGMQLNYAHAIVFSEVQITSNTASQENPDIYVYNYSNYIIVWQDNRNGNWDIYLTMFGYGVGATGPNNQSTPSPSPGNTVNPGNQELTTIIVSATAIAVARRGRFYGNEAPKSYEAK